MDHRRNNRWLLLLGLALIASVYLSLVGLGEATRILWQRPAALLSGAPDASGALDPGGPARSIILDIRLPRAVLAVLVGALLALSGVIMQAFFRNVMAEPYLVGVSSGAAPGPMSIRQIPAQ